ncbi:12432_t:CDS:1, partial [Cetraspora pellucida]
QKLKFKIKETDLKVMIQDESYTSKTCSNCGNIQNIGGKKVYKCKNCSLVIDRDVNEARGIFLRALLDGAIYMHM